MIKTKVIQRILEYFYLKYKENPKEYNKLFEIEQNINSTLFFEDKEKHTLFHKKTNALVDKEKHTLVEMEIHLLIKKDYEFFLSRMFIYKSPNFDKLKKIWKRHISFPKITDLNLNNFFVFMEKESEINFDLEDYLRKRDIIISFVHPYLPSNYIFKEIPPEENDNTDLKHVSWNKMSGNTIKNPRGGLVLKGTPIVETNCL